MKQPEATQARVGKEDELGMETDFAVEALRQRMENPGGFDGHQSAPDPLPEEVLRNVARLLDERDKRVFATAPGTSAARRKQVEFAVNNGYELSVPPAFKWHESRTKDPNFVNNICSLNLPLLLQSMDKLLTPKTNPLDAKKNGNKAGEADADAP